LEVVPADETELRNRILSASAEGIAFLLRAHVSSGEQRGAMPRAFALLETTHPNYSIAFNRRATEVRIDYVQHALSAMLAFDRAASELHAR
jgi:hypothetical protein